MVGVGESIAWVLTALAGLAGGCRTTAVGYERPDALSPEQITALGRLPPEVAARLLREWPRTRLSIAEAVGLTDTQRGIRARRTADGGIDFAVTSLTEVNAEALGQLTELGRALADRIPTPGMRERIVTPQPGNPSPSGPPQPAAQPGGEPPAPMASSPAPAVTPRIAP
jgi:acyl-CoA synthetase (AMP-forming)/AMP-acid ligase II